MENQEQFRDILPEGNREKTSRDPGSSWWEFFRGRLDLGIFYYPGGENPIYLNQILGEWLDEPSVSVTDESAFWGALSSLAAAPAQANQALRNIRESSPENQLLQFPSKAHDGNLVILFCNLTDAATPDDGYGGFVLLAVDSNRALKNLFEVFDNLLVPARQLTAAVQGNLQALAGNLQIWSPDVLDQFLLVAREDSTRLRQYLDIGLSYSKVLNHSSLINQPVSLTELLDTIIEEQDFGADKVRLLKPEGDRPLLANIDQAMVKVALETILREVVDKRQSGQYVELRLTEQEGFIILNLDSPRMLPLPGLGDEAQDKKAAETFSPELILVEEIITALGGNLVFEPRLTEEWGGLDIAVYLPALDQTQMQPTRYNWKEIFGESTGRILVAEAQPEYQIRIRDALNDLGYRVDLATDGNTVLDLIQTRQPNLIIQARDMPGMDGLLITQGIRRWSAVPIIMISMRESIDDRLYAYRLGVDDYIQKPFLMEELIAKVQVFLFRQEAAGQSIVSEIYHEGSIRIDYGTRQVWVRGILVQLTPIEYNLLVYLSRQGRQIIPYGQLLENVWDGPEKGTRQGLFVHVRRLRGKIEEDLKNPTIISNKWGVGYEFNP